MNARIILLITVLIVDVASALGVVYARHQSRQLAVQLGQLEAERDNAIAEWSRLQLEQAWRADAGQIEAVARRELDMRAPEDTRILVISR